jgi:protein-L-isoaspartate(D-aspartate) O-methyltransferase
MSAPDARTTSAAASTSGPSWPRRFHVMTVSCTGAHATAGRPRSLGHPLGHALVSRPPAYRAYDLPVGVDISADLRRELVDQLRRNGHLTDPRVAAAFLDTPREAFLPDHAQRYGLEAVYRDEAIVTRRDPATGLPLSSSSQPAIMARMLEMLDVEPGHRVLEIGAGTGYNAALLALLAAAGAGDRGGSVTTIELDRDVAAAARDGLLATRSAARVMVGDGRQGAPEAAPLDRIMVTASTPSVPRAWFDQLRPGGLLVVPLRLSTVLFAVQAVAVFRKVSAGFDSVDVTAGGFMALRGWNERRRGATLVVPELSGASGGTGDAGDADDRPLVEMWGPAIAGMDTPARQRLVVTALGFARRRRLDLGRGSSWSLAAYAALGLPEERLVECSRPEWVAAGELGLGVVDAVDGSVAFLVGGSQRARIEAHGPRGAELALLNVIDRWRSAGRPGVERLRVRVRYGPERPQAWRSLRRGDQWVALDWRPPPRRPAAP